MNTHPKILAAHKAHIEAARQLMEAVQLAYPKGTRVKVEWWNDQIIIGKVLSYPCHTNLPSRMTIVNEKTGKCRDIDTTSHNIEILP